MPNIITHTLFAREIKEKLDWPIQELIKKNPQLFDIGSNGPDFLFFHCFSPKRVYHKKTLRSLGGQAHVKHISEFYLSAIDSIRKEKDPQIREQMLVYTMGHLCHWALDSTAHPYVYYRTGNERQRDSWWHHRLESLIDAIMLKVKKECTISDFRVYEVCDTTLDQARAIARIWVPVGRNVFGKDVQPHEIKESLDDWHFMQKLFYDQRGNKYKSLRTIEKLTHTESFLSGYLIPNEPDDPFDVMNLLHKKWVHPCDETITSTESFFDLYDRALGLAQTAVELFYKAVDDDEAKEELVSMIGQKDYTTGLEDHGPMRYFSRIQDFLNNMANV